ncbi:MAG: phosphate ABC transporter permease subunit PstC [Candidatus Margulisiibacteriota bacterium]|jgi:phosphate transport system permease protein
MNNIEPQNLSLIKFNENAFKKLLFFSGTLLVVILIAIFLTLCLSSLTSIKELGLGFLLNSTWDPANHEFGALSFIIGTLLTSFLALLISLPFSLSLAIFLGFYFKKGIMSSILKSTLELLAGIPSVIYGFWALFVLVPVIRFFEINLGIVPYGVGILTASLVLAIMIIPYSASIAREVITLIPTDLKEAGFALGATPFEVIRKVILPYASSGIFAGVIMALGRALGETMAVTMVIGNNNNFPLSIFAPGNTMASILANEFSEANDKLYISSLLELGLILLIITMIVNLTGRLIIKKWYVK